MLIAIDDVESLITTELSSSQPSSAKLIGVPPSKGRGGNQTPRSESVYITGSQPLPSPSSSFGSSPMLDRWAFGMSKIEGNGGPASSTERTASADADEAARAIGKVSLDAGVPTIAQPQRKVPPGPSLLSQLAPVHVASPEPDQPEVHVHTPEGDEEPAGPGTAKAMAIPVDEGFNADLAAASLADASERITVKIADLGNGELTFNRVTGSCSQDEV